MSKALDNLQKLAIYFDLKLKKTAAMSSDDFQGIIKGVVANYLNSADVKKAVATAVNKAANDAPEGSDTSGTLALNSPQVKVIFTKGSWKSIPKSDKNLDGTGFNAIIKTSPKNNPKQDQSVVNAMDSYCVKLFNEQLSKLIETECNKQIKDQSDGTVLTTAWVWNYLTVTSG